MNRTERMLALLWFALPGAAGADVYELPPEGNDVIGAVTVIRARADDTLLEIARRHGLGYEDIVRANPGVDTWLPGEGAEVILPTRFVLPPGPRRGLVLNVAEYRLYYFPEPAAGEAPVVMTYPISIGRMNWETPLGRTSIVAKATDPSWYPPDSIRAEHVANGDPLPRVVPPGPDNPLGKHAMRLGLPGYLIHGTNRPAGVGMRVSHGCIRMFPEDIAYLFDQVGINTALRIINEPVKVGWNGEELVVEVHVPLEVVPPSDTLLPEEAVPDAALPVLAVRDNMTALTEQFVLATSTRPGKLDWDVAEELLQRADGIPAAVGRQIKDAATSAASK
jgi:L,D-transpeptidase ErfK/SrfK